MSVLATIWAAIRASKAAQLVAIALAALAALKGVQWRARRQGRREAMKDAKEADHERASEIRRSVDEVVRRADDAGAYGPDELRNHPARRN